jgi:hypothetical protein
MFDENYLDNVGNQIFVKKCGKENAPKIMLDAHMDEIGMYVTEILDGGFLRVTNIGGIDTGILQASDVIIYGKNALNCKQFLTKGSQIFAEGRLHLDAWESRDGDKRSKLVVIAENVQFMNNRRGVEQQYAPPVNNEYPQEPEW